MRQLWNFAPLALMLLAFDPSVPSAPVLHGAVVVPPRIAFGISADFKRDSLNRLFLYPGDTAIMSANTYNSSGQRVTTDKLVWLAENPKALAIKGVKEGQAITLVALQPDSVARFRVTWTTYGISAALTIRTQSRVTVTQDTTAARVAIEPSPIAVKANDSTIIRIRAWNERGIELFGKKNATFELQGDTHDLALKPFGTDPQARWVVAGPCPTCTTIEQPNAFLRQTAKGLEWQVRTPFGWQYPEKTVRTR